MYINKEYILTFSKKITFSFAFILFCLLSQVNASFGQVPDIRIDSKLLCKQLMESNKSKNDKEQNKLKIDLRKFLKIYKFLFLKMFAPSKLIGAETTFSEMEELTESEAAQTFEGKQDNDKGLGTRIAFLSVEKPEMSEVELERAKEIVSETDKWIHFLKKSGFASNYKLAKKTKTITACMDAFGNDEVGFNIYSKIFILNLQNEELLNKYEQLKYVESPKNKRKMKWLERQLDKNNWIIVKNKTVNEIMYFIQTKRPVSILFLGHAGDDLIQGNEGKFIYDFKNNIFPASFFHNMPTELKEVVFYNCHGKEVVNNYKIKEQQIIAVHFQLKNEFEEFNQSGDVIPYTYLKALKKIINKKPIVTGNGVYRNCLLKISHNDSKISQGIFLNQSLIGVIAPIEQAKNEQEIYFNCKLIQQGENSLFFNSLNSTEQLSIESHKTETLFNLLKLEIKKKEDGVIMQKKDDATAINYTTKINFNYDYKGE